ncbi:hypothetical protein Tco_1007169, partial [Tanacetum coccineum]
MVMSLISNWAKKMEFGMHQGKGGEGEVRLLTWNELLRLAWIQPFCLKVMQPVGGVTYPKVHENLKLITDERVFDDNPESHYGSMSSMKNLDDTYNFGDQFLYDKPTEDDQEKSKVRKESDSTIPDPSHQTVTSTPPVIAPFIDVSSTKPSLLVNPPPMNTEATTITTSLPEITSFIALQLRVARLEQEMSEVKKTDHSADVLASIKSQVPTAVDKYLGTKLDDALLKVLERHTTDLIKKYSVMPGPESIHNQESEKSPKEIIRTKKKQADEDAMDKEIADNVKDHKRKHDSDDEDDIPMQDEGHVSDMEDTDNAHIPKVSTTTRTGKKKLCKADLEGPAFNLVKAFHKNNVFLQYQMDECHKLLSNKVDLYNFEGHQILRNVYEPLPLGGPPGQ